MIRFMVKNFLTWQLKVYIHTTMVNTSGAAVLQESLPFCAKASPVTFWQIECLYCSDQRKWDWFMMKSFLPWQMKVYIHTKMVDTYGAADSPKEAFIFLPRHNLLRFGELNASTAQIRGYKIIFFWWKGAAVLPQKVFLFVPKRHLLHFCKLKTILSSS